MGQLMCRKHMGLKEIILHVKPASILVQLKDEGREWYASSLAKQCGATYVYTTQILNEFKKEELVVFESRGRTKGVRLTEKGMQVANALGELFSKVEKKEEKKP